MRDSYGCESAVDRKPRGPAKVTKYVRDRYHELGSDKGGTDHSQRGGEFPSGEGPSRNESGAQQLNKCKHQKWNKHESRGVGKFASDNAAKACLEHMIVERQDRAGTDRYGTKQEVARERVAHSVTIVMPEPYRMPGSKGRCRTA